MSAELEAAAVDSLRQLKAPHAKDPPPPGSICPNCQTELCGHYCHVCGQVARTRKPSILHLIWESIESLFHLDGRLLRTLPALFLAPGRLAKDYMEGRVARHVPPFRTFLVALLLFIFAAEHFIHRATLEAEHKAEVRAEALKSAEGRAAEAARIRRGATLERDEALKDLAESRTHAESGSEYGQEGTLAGLQVAKDSVQATYREEMAKADDIAAGKYESSDALDIFGSASGRDRLAKELENKKIKVSSKLGDTERFVQGARKALDNPEYYLSVIFTWGHRLAILLLPIVGLSLALVYVYRRKFYLYDHLLVAMNLLSFSFLAFGLCLVLPIAWQPAAFGIALIWTPINLFQTLRSGYGSSLIGATVKTLIVGVTAIAAFTVLIATLMIFSLGQL